jgi:hypothetical protein
VAPEHTSYRLAQFHERLVLRAGQIGASRHQARSHEPAGRIGVRAEQVRGRFRSQGVDQRLNEAQRARRRRAGARITASRPEHGFVTVNHFYMVTALAREVSQAAVGPRPLAARADPAQTSV